MSREQTVEIDEQPKTFLVVHPLDDIPENKLETDHLGPMRMTRSVRYSLFALRAYLV